MDPQQITALLTAVAAVPDDRRKRLDSLLEQVRREVATNLATAPRTPTVESLTGGAPLELGFTVALELGPAQKATFAQAQQATPDVLPLPVPLAQLPPDLFAKLQAIEAPLLRWLDKPRNAALFAVDPTAAVEKMAAEAGTPLDPQLLNSLGAIRKAERPALENKRRQCVSLTWR